MQNYQILGLILASVVAAFFIIGMVFARLYRRSTKELSFVRTGFGGQKVIMSGGTLVMPVLHETIPVNMNTLRLEVGRSRDAALITMDRIRVDVKAEFFVRVRPTEEAIADAAQTLGLKTMNPEALKELIEAKFVDALRAVAAEMKMEQMHEKRADFVQKVQQVVSEDILKNGLELEAVSLTSLDQTGMEFLNPQNAFDAQGLAQLTQIIESRRKQRNDIEQDTRLAIERKNLEANQESLQLSKQQEWAKLEQEREISLKRAAQMADIASEQARKSQEAKQVEIASDQQIKQSAIMSERAIREEQINTDREVQSREIEKKKLLELAEQERSIAVAERERAQSEAKATAAQARALAVRDEEAVTTARDREIAERQKLIQLVEAQKEAERIAIGVTVAAGAEKTAALDHAEAVKTIAQADADRVRIAAQGEADATKLRADAARETYNVDAEGRKALNAASNLLSPEIIAMEIRKALIDALPGIIRESVKPLERIEGIRIVQVGGLGGGASGDGASSSSASGLPSANLSDQVVQSALRYRAQAPLVDSLLKEIGLGSVSQLAHLPEQPGAPEPEHRKLEHPKKG